MIAAGFGFRTAATVDSLSDALTRAGGPDQVAMLATAADKAAQPSFCTFAGMLDLPVRPVDAQSLARQATITQSAASLSARGTGSVAEAAALAAAGPGARLLKARVVSGDGLATCALAAGENR